MLAFKAGPKDKVEGARFFGSGMLNTREQATSLSA